MTTRRTIAWITVGVLLASCHPSVAASRGRSGGSPAPPRVRVYDQQPMYGGVDRRADPRLAEADDRFIAAAAREFGSRRKASDMFVEEGLRARQRGDNRDAMKRFNQAWLLDPEASGSFYGFAAVLHDRGRECEATRMMERALENNLTKPVPLADASAWYAQCAATDVTIGREERTKYQSRAKDLMQKAINLAPGNDYIYGQWGAALYWQGDYRGAWEKVRRQRELGGTPSARTINLLREKMQEP